MNSIFVPNSTVYHKTAPSPDRSEDAIFDDSNSEGDVMAGNIEAGNTHEVKEVVETDITGEESALDETKLSTWQMVIRYKPAVLWSAFMGLAAINWGMDVPVSPTLHLSTSYTDDIQLSNGVISVPSFQKDFGYLFENQYIVSYSWQIAFNTSSSIGGFFGAIGSGYLADRLGKRMTLGLACIVSIGAVFIQIFAAQPGTLLAGKVSSPIPTS
jgi:SP family general alpha glucoside:H+ symporter-like MFS transporter